MVSVNFLWGALRIGMLWGNSYACLVYMYNDLRWPADGKFSARLLDESSANSPTARVGKLS